jgi:carbamoyl-phosphate synthase small subunit
MAKKKLILENGMEFLGEGFGHDSPMTMCEIVFNTSMAGYQEIVSDPSYTDQMVVMTYPLIGNYGITDEDYESHTIGLKGMIVREYNDLPSNFRYTKTLGELLDENGVSGISGVDTRMITRIIRDQGSMTACICNANFEKQDVLEKLAAYKEPTDQIKKVSCKKIWYSRTPNHVYSVVAVDCGIKLNMVRILNQLGCNVTIVPYNTSAQKILSLNPDGVFFSNGPGDPQNIPEVAQTVRELVGKKPIMGVCMGHQVICLAFGAKTYKLKFGHRGGNHPVKDVLTGKVSMTSQNHSYAVDQESLKDTCLSVTHINLLDNTVEGVKSEKNHIFSVQFHPESAPGPVDSIGLFYDFLKTIKECKD